MPEMLFEIAWPDGCAETCYSPSQVIRDYLTPGETYPLAEFVRRSSTALGIASDRVREKYGFACSRALVQRARIEQAAAAYVALPDAIVRVISFKE
jgi:uncharacterized repeat protein (TIGR04042 family)